MRPFATLLLAMASTAFAQGTGEWVWHVTTPDGDAVVEPGEAAHVTLRLDLTPDVGEQQADGEFVHAFGGATPLHVWGGANVDQGAIVSWEANPFLAFPGGHNDGTNITDIILFQFPGNPIDRSDPIDLVSFLWKPDRYAPMTVSFGAESFDDTGPGFFVWETYGQNGDFHPVHWDLISHEGTFIVVPSPVSAALICIAMLVRRLRPCGAR